MMKDERRPNDAAYHTERAGGHVDDFLGSARAMPSGLQHEWQAR